MHLKRDLVETYAVIQWSDRTSEMVYDLDYGTEATHERERDYLKLVDP